MHHIDTFGPPVFAKTRRLALDHLKIQHMLDLGHMHPSNSNYAAPLHLVSKKGSDNWHLVGDYRVLNSQTKRDLSHSKLFDSTWRQFGLCNASSTFQRFIDEATRGLDGVYTFIDDILIASQSYEKHIEHLRALFSRLDPYGLTI
ncbi:transposon Ty3-G Gag-Pol polyprotein [Nephila pilipes]|uniref:Transposon Ty3-G Gag-Pol polyprotein n=1 Tax=Nephila pilipes TaxID=299642 RepID=A0A8X6PMY4_NEPPI|nr:transposon Ty3-G Gag-Pol polyprotein [Nephila pilipes]GFU09946.1 transposon Ty3-G Gag-Pol polyprotein [Nephila pilipes]